MQLQTYRDLQLDVLHNLWRIPSDVDVIVGIPRSGMLVASMISLMLNLPMADLEGYCNGRVLESGTTRRRAKECRDHRHALIVDDSGHTGSAMRNAREQLISARIDGQKITTCVVYGTSSIRNEVDIVMKVIDRPRIFEWNVLHHPGILRHACLDIDGVLCHDPTEVENDDAAAYLKFLVQARPLYLPSHFVGSLVTSRLEKYRTETENWLRRYGISYGELIMMDLPTAAARQKARTHGSYKGEYYRSSSATLFIESELWQAREIAAVSGKPVLALEGPEMCLPNAWSPTALHQRLTNKRLLARWLRGWLGDRAVNKLSKLYFRLNAGQQSLRRGGR